MLVGVEFQVLAALECLHANVAFVRPKVAVRDFVLLERAVRRIDASAGAARVPFARMVLLVALQIRL